MRATAALTALLAAGVVAACGGGDDVPPAGGGGVADPEGPATQVTAARAQELFQQRCASCHVLAAAQAGGQVGPNLDNLRPDAQRVLLAIRTGPGVMPEGLLDGAEARAVAEYVAENAGAS